MSVEHLSKVLVLTELESAGGPITILSLCARLEGERVDVERYVTELQRLGKVVRQGEMVAIAKGPDPRIEPMSWALRGYLGMGLAPREDPAGPWSRMSPADVTRWERYARQVLHSADVFTAEQEARSPDKAVYWRGSVSDVVTDLDALLTLDQLQELASEAAVAWRRRRLGIERLSREVVAEARESVVVHVLTAGRALCGTVQGAPVLWPPGHVWDHGNDPATITCADCRRVVAAAAKLEPPAYPVTVTFRGEAGGNWIAVRTTADGVETCVDTGRPVDMNRFESFDVADYFPEVR